MHFTILLLASKNHSAVLLSLLLDAFNNPPFKNEKSLPDPMLILTMVQLPFTPGEWLEDGEMTSVDGVPFFWFEGSTPPILHIHPSEPHDLFSPMNFAPGTPERLPHSPIYKHDREQRC